MISALPSGIMEGVSSERSGAGHGIWNVWWVTVGDAYHPEHVRAL